MAAACPTARASSTGRWARWYGPSARSSTTTRPRPRARSSTAGSARCSPPRPARPRSRVVARPTWGAGTGAASTVGLQPLRDDEAQALVGALLTTGAQAELAPAVAARSGGNPLFAEELVQRLLEEGTDDATDLPETVHALLAARLDALAPFERRLAQHAAVIGRTFWRAALEPIARAEGGDLDAALTELEARELIVPEHGRGDEPELAFKHVLIREVAYARLPKAVRARKHVEVAAFLEQRA